MEKTIPFMRVSKKNQILKNLTKKVKDLYTETANVKPVLLTQSCWLFAICGQESARLLHLWDSPGKKTGVGCHFLLQGIFPTQGSNLDLLHCRQTLYRLSHASGWAGHWEDQPPYWNFKWCVTSPVLLPPWGDGWQLHSVTGSTI